MVPVLLSAFRGRSWPQVQAPLAAKDSQPTTSGGRARADQPTNVPHCHVLCAARRHSCNCLTSARISAACARSWRTLLGPRCRFLPFWAQRALPWGVRGPVANCQGLCRSADSRSRRRPSSLSPFHSARLRLPAATLLGLGAAVLPDT